MKETPSQLPWELSPNMLAIWQSFSEELQNLILHFQGKFHLSFSQFQGLLRHSKDLLDWREEKALLKFLWKELERQRLALEQSSGQASGKPDGPQQRREAWQALEAFYSAKQAELPRFHLPPRQKPKLPKLKWEEVRSEQKLLGPCPVASVKTRCCNLQTLDVIQQCGFNCSYCAVQHFYNEKAVQVPEGLPEKLKNIQLDPERWYHIGTGQASDSMLWSKELGILEPLLDFARRNPRVMLELKTKSANISELLSQALPKNIFITWSLNPDNVIAHEESLTAPLEARLRAARTACDHGLKVGFHFHPMIRYQGWKNEYQELATRVCQVFKPSEIICISMGSLTFSKSVLKTIRNKSLGSQILRFPMEEIAGKFSYPYDVKKEMFASLYQAFSPWESEVFFYLCMEDPRLWPDVFGFDYTNNLEFEQDMLQSYRNKLGLEL